MPLTSTIATYDGMTLRSYSYASKAESYYNLAAIFTISTLHDILTIGHTLEIETLWVVPGSPLSHDARQLLEESHVATEKCTHCIKIYTKSCTDDGTPRFLLIGRQGDTKHSIKLAFPEHDDRWPWRRCTDGATLLKSILYLQDALGCEIAWSPGRVGQGLMLSMNAKHPNWLAPVELPDVVKEHLAVDMKWNRTLTDEEMQPGMWLHLFDGNSKYLAACTSVMLGEGEPEYFESHAGDIRFDPRRPGLWHILEWDRWVWTPELEYLFAGLDRRPLIHDAYLWMDAHQALRSWGEHMWAARQKLDALKKTLGEPCELAYEAIKLIYVQAMGWLTFDRPDHWSMIVAGATRSTGFKKRQMAQPEHNLPACYWKADMLGFVSEGESLKRFDTMLNRATSLGGYKHVASGPLTPELAAAFAQAFGACDKALSKWRDTYE